MILGCFVREYWKFLKPLYIGSPLAKLGDVLAIPDMQTPVGATEGHDRRRPSDCNDLVPPAISSETERNNYPKHQKTPTSNCIFSVSLCRAPPCFGKVRYLLPAKDFEVYRIAERIQVKFSLWIS